MPAREITLDFTKADSITLHRSGRVIDRGHANDFRPMTPEGKLLTPKQIRARARRASGKNKKKGMSELEFRALYKPIEEWDLEELARGRPRDKEGGFRGRKPSWVSRDIHERAMEQFTLAIKTEMSTHTISALDTLKYILGNEEVDERGKPIVSASAKNQAAMFLLEHVVGKPKQHVQQDISVKLQGILGQVMVNPHEALSPVDQGGSGAYEIAHYPGHTIPIGAGPGADDDEEFTDD